jgi:hypothetical protein
MMNSASSDTVSAAQAIVGSLIEHGIDVVFGIPGKSSRTQIDLDGRAAAGSV